MDGGTSEANVIMGENGNNWEIVYDDNALKFFYYYTYSVPEPATYATIFGILALALVIYKRRK